MRGDDYEGLSLALPVSEVYFDGSDVLVRTEVAKKQLPEPPEPPLGPTDGDGDFNPDDGDQPPDQKLRRFHGSVRLDPGRLGSSSATIGDEILQHLAGLLDAEVTVTLDIEAWAPDGIPEKVVRDVSENARVLNFEEGYGFEEE